MNRWTTEKEKLFDEYNLSLQVIWPGAADAFVCPLCMSSFKKEDIYNGNLSLEHIPPKSIQAVCRTITCTRCNNTIGTKLQRFMVNDVRRKELEAGIELKKPFPVKVQAPGYQFEGEITSIVGGNFHVVSPLSILPPGFEEFGDSKKFAGTEAAISLKGLGTKELLDRAYLHSSYLALFSLLGYPYIMQPFMTGLRQNILDGQPTSIGSRITLPPKLAKRMPFINPREKKVEVSLIYTIPDPAESCLSLYTASELVLMPFVNEHSKTIKSDFEAMLSDLEAGKKGSLPFHIRLLQIDPSCKNSIGFIFGKGKQFGDWPTLKLSPMMKNN